MQFTFIPQGENDDDVTRHRIIITPDIKDKAQRFTAGRVSTEAVSGGKKIDFDDYEYKIVIISM